MRILIAGDYSPRDRISRLIAEDNAGSVFEQVKPVIDSADYSIVNFETTVIDNKCKPIFKYGPNLYCNKKAVALLKHTGFDCVTLANNHFRDYSDRGVKQSLSAFEEFNIDYMGGGLTIDEAQRVLYKKIDGLMVAFVNFCENEFSIATENQAGCAPLDPVANYYQIKNAKSRAEIVIVIVHGGHEHYQYPSPRMKRLYHFFVDLGADAVVNHHQHCYSGQEIYKNKPIVYGLGNFCFDHPKFRSDKWNEGYMACLCIENEQISYELYPYIQCSDEATVRPMNKDERKVFDERIAKINTVLASEEKTEKEYQSFLKDKKRAVLGVFTPYQNEYVRAAAGRHWLPLFLPKRKLLAMKNYIICESQRDATLGVLNDMIEL